VTLDLLLIVELVLLGICSGFLAGLLGIGGGMVMVPFISYFLGTRGVSPELGVKMAIATSMATIMFTSLSSVRAHHKRGAVRWDLVRTLAPGIVAGSLLASLGVFSLLKGSWLAILFALFVGFSATQMFRNTKPQPSRQLPGSTGRFGAGAGIGFLSGMVGAGGGFISVPFMVWCNVPMRQVVATSAALGFPIALFNAIGYVASGWSVTGTPAYSFGYVWLPALLMVCLSTVFTAPIGARMAHRWPVKKLKRAFAVLLYALATSMLYRGLTA
jgi:uncharacterized membrane protein YfcA